MPASVFKLRVSTRWNAIAQYVLTRNSKNMWTFRALLREVTVTSSAFFLTSWLAPKVCCNVPVVWWQWRWRNECKAHCDELCEKNAEMFCQNYFPLFIRVLSQTGLMIPNWLDDLLEMPKLRGQYYLKLHERKQVKRFDESEARQTGWLQILADKLQS